ncbi:hypothetical protein ABL78_1698 [Leptomonas seymouri]|uniref:Uncharacterized protein n=1 Tax=Leptomonas seymouri TaxID=5684 RepID=A0A0N1I728_LEPSE|nr:hypothetical protein ABL78_1698 [Leptomonas seymouri]|eukprot:KPI89205.1 hypothetical protein ABL78_1698 [Leptomonas seymouri]
MLHAPHHTDDDEARLPTCAEQLQDLAQSLPQHIEHTVLPRISEETASSAADLSAQVEGTRQLLLQSAVLRRSAVLAPILKQQLVRSASRLQRRRAQLVQVLQRHTRGWQASASSFSHDRSTAVDKQSALSELRFVWHALEAEMYEEEKLAYIVQTPLCPSTATLTSFLAAAVTQKGLHRRVLAQVEGGEVSPGVRKTAGRGRPPTPLSTSPSPPSLVEGTSESVDAIEEALHLLLHHVGLGIKTSDPASAAAKRKTGSVSGSASPRPASPSAEVSSGPMRSVGGRLASVHCESRGSPCDVDGDSDAEDDEEVQLLQWTAEEDAHLHDPLPVSSPPQQEGQEQRHSLKASSSLSGPWLRVPGIVSLRQFCADLPWVVDVAEQRYAEAREGKKHSGSGEVGYFSCHVQPDEGGAEGAHAASRGQRPPSLPPTVLGPLGCVFLPALATGSDDGSDCHVASATSPPSSPNSRVESTIARAMRYAAAAGSSVLPSNEGRHASASAHERESARFGSGAQADERTVLARALAQFFFLAVHEAWKDVEAAALIPLYTAPAHEGSASSHRGDDDAKDEEKRQAGDEEEAVSSFLEVMRVRYAVELAAQVVAARQAVELLLDSEDGVVFDGARLLSLSLNSAERAGAEQRGDGMLHGRGAASSTSSVFSCTVLTLPGLEEIFYVVAYCIGAAMLRGAAAAMSLRDSTEATGGSRLQRGEQQLVIDVDAQEEAASGGVASSPYALDSTNEEDGAAQQQASLHAWAAGFEEWFLSPPAPRSPNARGSPLSASPSLASLFRLWVYLWRFVLAVQPPNAAADHDGDQPTRQQPPGKGPRRRNNGSATPTQLLLSLRTARRWMEKVVDASLLHGLAVSGVMCSAASPVPPHLCLTSFWSPSETERVVRLTTLQARQALQRAADADASA